MNKLTKSYRSFIFIGILIGLLLSSLPLTVKAQVIFGHIDSNIEPFYNKSVFQTLDFRSIGPYRGGRSLAVEGIDDNPLVYYAGFTGGGVFKTVDGGETWFNISDDYFKTGAVGAFAVSNSDPNIIYVGMGEACIRGNMQAGDGIYKSTNGGKTWTYVGLGQSWIIGEIIIHPENPNTVWVAAMGQIFGKDGNKMRGVFKTTNGGKTWEKVLYKGPHVGAVHLEIDPSNPRVLYASFWEAYRTPWSMSSGGDAEGGYQSALYKTTDGGKTWTLISDNPGMPRGILGKMEVAISPAKPDRVWALIEAENASGLYRSDNNGKTWTLINSSSKIWQRSWYYMHVIPDPKDPNTLYILSAPLLKSVDGGKTFFQVGVTHGDVHDLWIDPDNPNRMIVADDGGAHVSTNGGKTWDSMFQTATGEFYHVNADNRFPYRLYGAQQDQGTVVIKNRTADGSIGFRDWHPVGGGESGYVVPDPNDPITYAGSYGGYLSGYNTKTGELDVISVWPENPMGHGAKDLKYRFQWTFPIYISPNNPDILYATSQYVHRSYNQGMSWERISPDLTRDEKVHQQLSGGPITNDNTSVEYYNTIYSFAVSPVQQGVLWAGADDGLIHLSRDNGETWTNVTPDALRAPKERARIMAIEPSPYDPSKVYIAATRYKQGNFEPLLFKSDDFGETWTKITNGIPAKEFTRVIRADPFREGLLYAGTETGMYISFNDGKKWQPFQLNLPPVAVTDIVIQKRDKDLILSTGGRGFYILDELAVLHQLSDQIVSSKAYLFKPEPTYLFGRRASAEPGEAVGQNPFRGVVVFYHLNGVDENAEIELQFLKEGNLIRTFSNKYTVEGKPVKDAGKFYEKKETNNSTVLSDKEGLNRFVWNMRYPGATELEEGQMFRVGSNALIGPEAVPGTYTVRLRINDEPIIDQQFKIKKDPRETATQEDLQAQFELYKKIIAKLDALNEAVNYLRNIQDKITQKLAELPDNGQLQKRLRKIKEALEQIERSLANVRAKSRLGPLAYPIKLNKKLVSLAQSVGVGKGRPTKQQYAVYNYLAKKVNKQLRRLEQVLSGELMQQIQEVENKPIPIEG